MREKWCARVPYKNAYEGYFEFYISFVEAVNIQMRRSMDRWIDTCGSGCLGEVAVEDAAGQPSEREKGRKVFQGVVKWDVLEFARVRSKGTSNPRQWPFQRNRVALPLISGAGRNTRVLLRGTTASLKEGFQTIRATFMCDGDHLSAASTLILKDLPRWRPCFPTATLPGNFSRA